jgi:hypothetical protein
MLIYISYISGLVIIIMSLDFCRIWFLNQSYEISTLERVGFVFLTEFMP